METLSKIESLDLYQNQNPICMKKTIMIVAAMVATLAASAQMTSKKGTAILPESGDWSIGVGANSTLSYFGNLLNGTADNSSPSFDWASSNVITGKMMKDANTAYRVGVRIGYTSNSAEKATVNLGGGSTATVDQSTSDMNINLSAGIQKYRGKGRLQGIYGAEVGIGMNSSSESWENGKIDGTNSTITAEVSGGGTFGFGVRGFIGAEYFFAPKMSLGGEFGWGIGLSSTSAVTTDVTVDGTKTSTEGGKSSSFGIDTDNANGTISLNLYF